MEEKDKNKSESALREERILDFWRENKTFEKTLSFSEGKKEFVFYEGPPTANGKPGIHHLEARAFKDVIPRYKTMKGYHVRRKGGWDTHGLPVELQVEKKLGLNSKKAIEEYGIAKFNQECKESVWEYLDIWNKFTKRIGFWVDQENPYVTYHNNFIESVWSVVKNINKQNLLYKDYKVVPWCPRCGTALSSHELAQGYEDVKDLSVYVKFKILNQKDTFILAWTTTPWTLPGNVALAVGEDIIYVKIKVGEEVLILAKERLSILGEEHEIIEEIKGKDLIGLQYEPLYPYLKNIISENEKTKLEKAYQIYPADFVTTADGTGVVHTAVMYGQDDFELGTKIGLPKQHLVGLDGKFLAGTDIFEGRFVKDEEVAVDIIKDLAHRGLLFKKEKYEHSYPHCWRCHTALIYYARDSWYIKVSDPKIKNEMISQNKEINWEPSHIRDGRFGEWLREIKDWAISRERYWGTPLPIWLNKDGSKKIIVDSIETLKKYSKNNGNFFIFIRHGESEHNVEWICNSNRDNVYHLTKKGKQQVEEAAGLIGKADIIYTSPFVRSKETAEILADKLGVDKSKIIEDERLREVNFGDFDNKSFKDFLKYEKENAVAYDTKIPGGESYNDAKKRFGQFLYEIDQKHLGQTIVVSTHGMGLEAVSAIIEGADLKRSKEIIDTPNSNFEQGGMVKFKFIPLSHNEYFELDLHRPYIDGVVLEKDGEKYTRTKEVMDVWFDSGCMPFAQDHYPFENKEWVEGPGYPADFISEAIDQTRGWFYTLHAVGVLMGRGKAYKNVICLGHLLDAKGKKMSKSIGNVVDPWEMMDKYGVDTLRLWMYSVNQPGESKNFDEKTVALLHQQVFGLLFNVLAFYELYRDGELEINNKIESKNVLDIWILARLNELNNLMVKNLDSYKLLEPVRAIRDFIGDLSTWYLRRSRERIKDGDKEAKQTLYFVLKTLTKMLAPFAPFSAEDIWLKLKNENDEESVHLTSWPEVHKSFLDTILGRTVLHGDKEIIENMEKVRNIVTLGLESRQKAGIKVRQPLAKLEVKNLILGDELVELIKDEINVKEIVENKNLEGEVLLDVKIDDELKIEGDYRELARALQDMRKKIGLTPSDVISISFETNETGKQLIQKFEIDMKKTVLASKIEFGNNDGEEIKIDELDFKVKIKK